MQVGQKVTAKEGVMYQNVYAQASTSSKKYSFGDSEYVGTVSKIDVLGGALKFTEVTADDKTKYYILNTEIYNYFDIEDAKVPEDTTTPTPSNNTPSTFDKIVSVFNGLLGIFNSTKKKETNTNQTDNSTDDSSSGDSETPDPSNNADSPLVAWIKTNWLVSILLIILVPGGIILGIIAIVKASKKKAQLPINQNTNGYKV
jgi:hypothetical protein